jgi:hypothetical protein
MKALRPVVRLLIEEVKHRLRCGWRLNENRSEAWAQPSCDNKFLIALGAKQVIGAVNFRTITFEYRPSRQRRNSEFELPLYEWKVANGHSAGPIWVQ